MEVSLANSYIAGTIFLGIAPCTAMVLMWGNLSYGNQGHTLVLLFAFKGALIVANPLHIALIAVPLLIQTCGIFLLSYVAALKLDLPCEDAVPAALVGASNHFEVAIAPAVVLFGLNSGAALTTVVGVLIEVPVMLLLVEMCKGTAPWFRRQPEKASLPDPGEDG